MTTGELIDAVLEYYVNQGSPIVTQDARQRKRAWFRLTQVCKRVFKSAPHWWKKTSGSVVLTTGVGTMPSDFSSMGTEGQIYISGQLYRPLGYRPPDWMDFQIINNVQSGLPWAYTLADETSLGVPKIKTWPQDNSTLLIKNYDRTTPELIDHPLSPNVAVGAVGLLTGAYSYKVTYVTSAGETEGGFVSATVSPTLQKIELTDIPISNARTVTSRKIYRTAAGGSDWKLVTTLADNLTTVFSDNVVDGSLGASVPTPAQAVTGVQIFPVDFHEDAIYQGLEFWMGRSQGDGREMQWQKEWDRQVQRLWEETQQGQAEIHASPPFPGGTTGHPVWSRWSPPS